MKCLVNICSDLSIARNVMQLAGRNRGFEAKRFSSMRQAVRYTRRKTQLCHLLLVSVWRQNILFYPIESKVVMCMSVFVTSSRSLKRPTQMDEFLYWYTRTSEIIQGLLLILILLWDRNTIPMWIFACFICYIINFTVERYQQPRPWPERHSNIASGLIWIAIIILDPVNYKVKYVLIYFTL